MIDIKEVRRRIHQNPELGNQEFETSALIKSVLDNLGVPYSAMAGTGVVGLIDNKKDTTILLRADMDALSINENTGLPFSSQNTSVMHACGHDVHVAMLLGTAQELMHKREQLDCNVKLVFQPDEEGDGGAKRMISEGVLETPHVDAALAFHVWPELPLGVIGVKSGTLTATCDTFKIKLAGSGGHIANSGLIANPIMAANELIYRLNEIKMDNPHVLGVCNINAGNGSMNIIPEKCEISGGVRVLNISDREKWQSEIARISYEVATKHGLQAEFEPKIFEGYPPLINDETVTQEARKIVEKYTKIIDINTPYFIAEDFASFAQEVPASMLLLGCSAPEVLGKNALHKSDMLVDERAIDIGINVLTDFSLNYKRVKKQNKK